MSSVYHLNVLVCHPYVTHTYSCVIRMALVYCFTMKVRKPYTALVSILHFATICYFGLLSFDGQFTQFSLLRAFTINSCNEKQ